MIRRMIIAVAAALLGVIALTGCSANDSLAQQYQEGNEKGYIAGDCIWIKAHPTDDGVRLEYAGLARGEDPTLRKAVVDIADAHTAALSGASDSSSKTGENR